MNAQPLSDSPAVTDADLLAAWRHGDAGAFDLLYARHRAPVYGFLLRLLGNRALADDVHQDLWLQVIERAGDFRAGGNVRTWLFTLARSRALDRLRREAVRDGARGRNPDARAYRIDPESRTAAYTSHEAGSDEAISDEAGLPDAVLGESVLGQAGRGALGAGDAPAEARLQGERAALLQRALAQLPEEQRLVFLMHEEGDLSLPEAAAALGIPYETARSRYRYALGRLRDFFGLGADTKR